MAVTAALCLATFIAHLMALRDGEFLCRPPCMGLLLLAVFFVALQLVPLPPQLLHMLSPGTWRQYQLALAAVDPHIWMPLSLHPRATWFELLRWGLGAAIYFLLIQYCRTLERLRILLVTLAWFWGGYAFISLMQYLLPGERIFWLLSKWPQRCAHPFGTFVNGNHYAGFAEMVLPLLLALFLALRPRVNYLTRREQIVEFFTASAASRHLLLALAAVIMAITVVLSLSRGGIISSAIAVAVFALLLVTDKRYRRFGVVIMVMMVLALTLVGSAGWDTVLGRFDRALTATGAIADQRPQYWRDCVRMAGDFPLFGSGAGTFIDSYARYKTAQTGILLVNHAHNDYLELLVTLGCCGMMLVAAFLLRLLYINWQVVRRRRNEFARLVWLGSLFGMVALLCHSVTDFNFYIGSNGYYFLMLCAVNSAAANAPSEQGRCYYALYHHRCGWLTTTGCMTLVVMALLAHSAATVADRRLDAITASYGVGTLPAISARRQLLNLHYVQPLYAALPYACGNLAINTGDSDQAYLNYLEAVRLRPLHGEYIEALALVLAHRGDMDLADKLLRAAIVCDPYSSQRYLSYITWLFSNQRSEQARNWVTRALQQYPGSFDQIMVLLALYGVDARLLPLLLPDNSNVLVRGGDYLLKHGHEALAQEVFKSAWRVTQTAGHPSSAAVWRLRRLYLRQHDYAAAIALLNEALKIFASDAGLHAALGDIYQREGISYRAVEEFRQAHMLAPQKQWIKQRLHRLEQQMQ